MDELHLFFGITKHIVDSLNEAWGDNQLNDWLEHHGIRREKYYNGAMNGNACNKLLNKKLHLLRRKVPTKYLCIVGKMSVIPPSIPWPQVSRSGGVPRARGSAWCRRRQPSSSWPCVSPTPWSCRRCRFVRRRGAEAMPSCLCWGSSHPRPGGPRKTRSGQLRRPGTTKRNNGLLHSFIRTLM